MASVEQALEMAKNYIASGSRADAMTLFYKILEVDPNNADASKGIATLIAKHCSRRTQMVISNEIMNIDPGVIAETLGPRFNRASNLGNMPWDLEPGEKVQFHHLAGLFASTSLDHATISMTVRQGAYLYGLVDEMSPEKVIEIGRYKGGSTLIIAAAMAGKGEFWSLDIGEKEMRLKAPGVIGYDEQIRTVLDRLGLKCQLLVGDSHVMEINTGEVDLVMIDGDHSYEGVKNDFERFGRRVRKGGAVLFDDAFSDGFFGSHENEVGRLINEIVSGGEFRLAKRVNRLAHLERL